MNYLKMIGGSPAALIWSGFRFFYGYKKDAFCTMVESTKQVSENYLSTEKGYADDWAAYIASCHMTAEEALDYIRTTNTQEDRAAHLVDMADLSARSTFVRNGNP